MASGSIRSISSLLLGAWNTVLAIGIVLFIVRYKLEFTQFFPLLVDLVSLQKIAAFVATKGEILLLCAVFLLRFIPLTMDARKWIAIGESCFSNLAMPDRFALVRWRWVILWVILCNMALFVALPWFSDNIMIFSALFSIHYLNSAVWIVAMRKNIHFYFSDARYQPPDVDINREFIQRRRDVVSDFMARSYNLSTRIATGVAFAAAFALAIAAVPFYAAPHIIVVAAQTINEYFARREREQRDAALSDIEREQFKPPSNENDVEEQKG